MSEKMKRLLSDMARVFVLLVATGAWLYYVDPANSLIFQAFGISVFFVGGSHLTRRVLFHQLDLQLIAKKAMESPIGAAVVFTAILVFLMTVILASVSVIK